MRFHGWLQRCLLVLPLLSAGAASAAAPVDPVEALREALYIRLQDTRNPPLAVLEHRRKVLEERIAELKSIRDLRRALTLSEWKEDIGEEPLRAVDDEMRRKIGERLIAAIRRIITTDDATSRLAVANMIAEMGPTVRALDRLEHRGFAHGLIGEVVALSKDPSLAVRLEALRALGTINADPQKAAPVLRTVIDKGDPQERRVAAYALGQMVRVVNHLLKRGQAKTGVEATRDDFIRTAVAVVEASSAGFDDPSIEVRQLVYEAVDTAAHALGDLIHEPFARTDFPPPGRLLTKDDLDLIQFREGVVKEELGKVAPLLKALQAQNVGLMHGLADRAAPVRLVAITALENMAYVRLRINRWIDSIPDPEARRVNGGFAPGHWAVTVYVDPVAGALKSLNSAIVLLYDPDDVRIRRLGIDFLERLGAAAAPGIAALADRLADEDRFVRWAAARTLGNLAPELVATQKQHAQAVRGLSNLVLDYDLDVRMAAAETLLFIGPPAAEALCGLNQSIMQGDPEGRMASMQAIASIGLKTAPADTADATVRNLCQLLTHRTDTDARVRRSAAATLGTVVPQLSPAMTASKQLAVRTLRDALGDDDDEVRVNAGDAILAIQVP